MRARGAKSDMNDQPLSKRRCLFTIGHSNHSLEEFLRLLRDHAIEVLADVRSHPHSKYAPHFDYRALQEAVEAGGIKYAFYGKELGGRPDGEEYYDLGGFVRYDRLAESPQFLEGIGRLERESEKRRTAILCSEENPAICHRRLLVGRVLIERGTEVLHIRGDGRLQTEEEVCREETEAEDRRGQGWLFDLDEVTEWRSIRSVSPRKPPPSSSEH